MKVLFLDIDGVMNTTPHVNKLGAFSRSAVVNLEMLLNKVPDLQIVVSSHWRQLGIDVMKDAFKAEGIDPRRIIDVTGTEKADGREREYQIAKWLADHPEARLFVIFDDIDQFVALKDRFVKTNPFVGLTQTNITKALEILNE